MGEKVKTGCLILGGSTKKVNPELKNTDTSKTFVICADKGYEAAKKLFIKPHLIVGDFDSAPKPDTDTEIITLPTHKDDTDLHFAVKEGIKRGYRDFVLSGVTGGRLDHTLAAISTLGFLLEQGIRAKISDINCEMYISDSRLILDNPGSGCYLSVFPFTEKAVVSISGAEYSVNNATLTSSFPIGVSNHFRDNRVEITVKSGSVIVLLINE